jgi:hypothetical protein
MSRTTRNVALGWLLASAFAAACGGGPEGLGHVPEGRWGGEGIALEVRASGAVVELDCAHGEITVPLRMGADGSFSLPGYYVRDVGPGLDPEVRRPANYSGRYDGLRLDLSFALETGEAAGPFTAVPDAPAHVQRCR